MSTVGTRKKGSSANLACGGYKLYGSRECTNHFIDYNTLCDIVMQALREQIQISEKEQYKLAIELQKETETDKNNDKEIHLLSQKAEHLDNLIEKIYEDNFQGTINDDRFQKLLAKYEKEYQMIKNRLEMLSIQEKTAPQSHKKFLKLVKSVTGFENITQDLLFNLIERIEIGQGQYEKAESGKVKHQKISVYFRFIDSAKANEYSV